MGPSVVMMENYCLVSGRIFTINFHQNTMTFGSNFLHIKAMKKNSPQKHFFRHRVRHISVKKLLLFTLQMNEIYLKRRTMTVAFQRMFGILERWDNNQVTPSLSKPHELSYRSNIIISIIIQSFMLFIFPAIFLAHAKS